MRNLLVLIWFSAVATASPALAQISRSEPQPGGSARITGHVLARDNGAPVRRALVRVAGTPDDAHSAGQKRAYVQRQAETDDYGAFDFAGLPGGSYSIDVFPANGFRSLASGRRAVVGEGRALDVPIRLERTGAIVGRIVDRNGEGLAGVEVHAVGRDDFRGHVTLISRERALTNDLGQFRLFNLSAGEYVVAATPVRFPGGPHEPETARPSGFVTTYYPGTRLPGDARRVVVRAGKDSAKVNFLLASGRLARVAVDAVDSRGLPLGQATSAMLKPDPDVLPSMSSTRHAGRQDDGQLVFSEVEPGDYTLIVSTSYRQEEAAYVNVKVDGDITLKVQTNSGAKVSGRVVIQGPSGVTTSDRPPWDVVVSASRPLDNTGPSYANVPLAHSRGTDRFELSGLRGPMVLNASTPWAELVSISRAGGEDLAGKPIQLTGTETIDDLVVVFTTEKAYVDVTVTGLREPDDPEQVLVILFSEDPARWHVGSVEYTTIRATAEMTGRMFKSRFGSVAPGRYLVVALPNPGVAYPTNPAILERLRPLATPVTLVAGETAKVEVRVSR